MTTERPDDFRDHHHRALVLLAGAEGGLALGTITTSSTITAGEASFLRTYRLAITTRKRAFITSEGRELLGQLHDEAHA